MASARQEALAQLGRRHAPEEPERHAPASSPLLCSAPSPVARLSRLGSSSPLGSFSAKVGPRLSAQPSFHHRLLEVATQFEGVLGDSALYRSALNTS